MTHMSIAIIASLLLLVHRSTAAITYTLAMDHAERFCGKAIHGYPTSGAGAPCSHPSPVWYNALGIGFNPNNKLAYTLDFYGESLTSVPVPDLSTGNVALVAGAIGCGSEAACRGTAVGPFLSTRFISPARVLMDSRLLPKFYVLEHGNCRMVELNLDTQISTVYLGTGAVGSLTDDVGYKNLPRTTAVMNHLVSADFTSDYMLPCHQPRFQPKVSHTTGIVTLLTENAECDTNGLFNGVLYIARLAVVTGYKVPSGDLFGVITGGAFTIDDLAFRISMDVEMKAIWVSMQSPTYVAYIYKYDFTTSTVAIIAGGGSQQDTTVPATSYKLYYRPGQVVRYGQLLLVAVAWLVRVRVDTSMIASASTSTLSATVSLSETSILSASSIITRTPSRSFGTPTGTQSTATTTETLSTLGTLSSSLTPSGGPSTTLVVTVSPSMGTESFTASSLKTHTASPTAIMSLTESRTHGYTLTFGTASPTGSRTESEEMTQSPSRGTATSTASYVWIRSASSSDKTASPSTSPSSTVTAGTRSSSPTGTPSSVASKSVTISKAYTLSFSTSHSRTQLTQTASSVRTVSFSRLVTASASPSPSHTPNGGTPSASNIGTSTVTASITVTDSEERSASWPTTVSPAHGTATATESKHITDTGTATDSHKTATSSCSRRDTLTNSVAMTSTKALTSTVDVTGTSRLTHTVPVSTTPSYAPTQTAPSTLTVSTTVSMNLTKSHSESAHMTASAATPTLSVFISVRGPSQIDGTLLARSRDDLIAAASAGRTQNDTDTARQSYEVPPIDMALIGDQWSDDLTAAVVLRDILRVVSGPASDWT
eukprot:PhM_4_TR14114/c0_g1_i2/m.42928